MVQLLVDVLQMRYVEVDELAHADHDQEVLNVNDVVDRLAVPHLLGGR